MSFVKDCRQAYPTIPILVFIEILNEYRDSDTLLERLDKAEADAIAANEKAQEQWRELHQRFCASEQHHRLHIIVPPDIDREHVQAVLMYGFLVPGTASPYIGKRVITADYVEENTQKKLGLARFSQKKYDSALRYLLSERVVVRHPNSGKGRAAYSLNSSTGESKPHGEQIVRTALQYLREK